MTMDVEDWFNLELDPHHLANKAVRPPTTPEAWKEKVRSTIQAVEVTEVGLLLLRSIRKSERWVTIRPYWWVGDDFNPVPRGKSGADALPKKESRNGRLYFAQIRFSPELYGRRTPCEARKRGGPGKEPHEVLFHELVHALRMVYETRLTDMGGQLGGGLSAHNNVEEFIAILVTNIYASRNREKSFRGGHYVASPNMPAELAGSFEFFKIGSKAFSLVKDFCEADKQFCDGLRKIEAPFNPIRAFFSDPDKARRLSESARAKERDERGDAFNQLRFFFWDYEGFEKAMAD